MEPEHERRPAGDGQKAPRGAASLPPDLLVRWGLYFYGAMAVAAVIWRQAIYGESILYAGPEPQEIAIGRDLAIGVAVGGAVVLLSNLVTRRTDWGDRMARGLAEMLVELSVPNALLLALASGLAEEMFFRGALQPRVGWLPASVIFGLIHFVPGRPEFLPWTAFAVLAGLLFGALFALTGNLIAPVAAHFVVNGVNLPLLVRDYAPGAPDRPGAPDDGEPE